MASLAAEGATTTEAERAAAAAMRTREQQSITNEASVAAAAVRSQTGAAGGDDAASEACSALESFAPVDISPQGVFKYVLVKATDPTTKAYKFLVRGVLGASYHKDAAQPTLLALEEAGLEYHVLGGGRINHNSEGKDILIYGFSCESYAPRGAVLNSGPCVCGTDGFPWENDEPKHMISSDLIQQVCALLPPLRLRQRHALSIDNYALSIDNSCLSSVVRSSRSLCRLTQVTMSIGIMKVTRKEPSGWCAWFVVFFFLFPLLVWKWKWGNGRGAAEGS